MEVRANEFWCPASNLSRLPESLPLGTNLVNIQGNSLEELCGNFPYTENVASLNLASNRIQRICSTFIFSLVHYKELLELDLSGNMLSRIPSEIQKVNNIKVWLHNNQFICDCDVLWMISWLANSTLPSGEHVVQDYKKVTCSNGVLSGKPIHKLNTADLSCSSHSLPMWEIALLAVLSLVIITICVTILVLFKGRNEVRFWAFARFNILTGKDEAENMEGIKFDGLVSYRYF